MVHELPVGLGIQVTALNFGSAAIDETVTLVGVPLGLVLNMLGDSAESELTTSSELSIRLAGYEGKSLLIGCGEQ